MTLPTGADLNIPDRDYAAYIFDNDGTLALSMHLHFEAWGNAYRTHGATFAFPWSLFMSMAGKGLHESVVIMNERFNHAMDVDSVVDYQETYVKTHTEKILPNEPVVSFARQVAKTHPVAVASGGYRATVESTLRQIGVSDLFPVVVTREDVEHPKPAPDMFLLAAQRLGVDPTRCLVFEDSRLGVEAAERAGMDAVFVDHETKMMEAKEAAAQS